MTDAAALPADPMLFDPALERPEPQEADTAAALDETLRGIRETTFADSGQALRSVHAKSHGILHGVMTVPAGLPPALAQGMFAAPGRYRVVMRFSTVPGDVLDDSVSTPRGVALKVIGVAGPRLEGSEGDVTQDFVLVNAPAFSASTAEKFLGGLKLLAGTTDKYEGVKKVASRVARGAEAVLEAFGAKSATLVTMGGQPATQILGETFYSQTPFRFGRHVCKFALAPASVGLRALTGRPLDIDSRPDALRGSVIDYFAAQGAVWELQVQLAADPHRMPIEDASAAWPEDVSPYVGVARIEVPVQDAWSEASRRAVDDGLSFSPWHGLAAHQPLGGVNRARRDVYRNSAAFRALRNGCPMHEPRPDADGDQPAV